MTVTLEWLESNLYRGVGIKSKQRKILGLPFPLEKGWKRKVIGMDISDKDARKFEELGSHPKKKNAPNLNDKRLFIRKQPRVKKSASKNTPLPFSKRPEDFPDLIRLTFDDLEKADMSLLGKKQK